MSSSWFGCIDIHWKNLIALSLSITIIVCASTATQSTQSTLNMDSGLGLASLSCVYISCALSCFYASIVVRFFGTKWAVVVGEICFSLFIAANLYPTFYTLIPISIVYGSSAGLLYTAQGTYLTSIAISYASKSNLLKEHIISRFNGIFYMIYFIGISPGSIMMSLMLQNGQEENDNRVNQSVPTYCGARDNCIDSTMFITNGNNSNINNFELPNDKTRTTIFVALLIFGMTSIIITIVFIDRLETFSSHLPTRDAHGNYGIKRLIAVAFSSRFLLLLPLIVLFSYDMAFFLGDVTKSFAGCTDGVVTIGYVTAVFFTTAGLSAFVIGYLVKITGRIIVLTVAWICQIVLMIFMLLWRPENAIGWEIYVMSTVYGIGSGLREAQVSSLLGILFPHDLEAAFSVLRFYWGTVIGIAFAVGTANLCVAYKIWFGITWYTMAMVFYYLLEWKISATSLEEDKTFERVKCSDDETEKEVDLSE
ncbi:protein unc-93 homolog A-like [Amphiura filiformis]|uniref:protein unc-93 homolog A-like n=1 Tax=Amphiura filiformis TaxID=82378 RepID=UPI003B226EE5